MPEQKDSEFTWRGFQDANNNELVGNFANFVNRVLVLVHKYYKGKVPKVDEDVEIVGSDGALMPSFIDSELMELFDKVYELSNCIWEYDFRGALQWLMNISSWGNQLLQSNEPWKIQKEEPEKVKVVMNLCVQIVAALSIACRPFLPETSEKMQKMLNLKEIKDHRELVNIQNKLAAGRYLVKAGHVVGEPIHLFSRIPDEVIDAQILKLKSATSAMTDKKENSPQDAENNMIQFDDFTKMDIRTATITKAERVPKADKLLKLEVDLGYETRTIVSGIAEHFEPDSVVGKKVSVLVNLQPRKIRGVESKGMILMADSNNGTLGFVSPPEGWENGQAIR